MPMPQPYQRFVGVDIAAKTATVVVQIAGEAAPARPFVIDQTPDGIAAFQRQLRQAQIAPATTLVVLEATGSCWITLATTLHHAGYAVSVINPAQAHHVAKALIRRSKTDPIDVQTLAQMAATLQPEPWTPPPPVYHELQQRLAQRDAWIALRQQVRNQRHALTQQPLVVTAVVARMDTLIATLDAQIAEVKAELRPALAGDAAWAAAARRLESIKGIGLVTALWILVSTLNFRMCATPEAATTYAGLAPREDESGTSVRRRKCIGKAGNARLRTALYMATLSAAQSNQRSKRFTSGCETRASCRTSHAAPPRANCCMWHGRWWSTNACGSQTTSTPVPRLRNLLLDKDYRILLTRVILVDRVVLASHAAYL